MRDIGTDLLHAVDGRGEPRQGRIDVAGEAVDVVVPSEQRDARLQVAVGYAVHGVPDGIEAPLRSACDPGPTRDRKNGDRQRRPGEACEHDLVQAVDLLVAQTDHQPVAVDGTGIDAVGHVASEADPVRGRVGPAVRKARRRHVAAEDLAVRIGHQKQAILAARRPDIGPDGIEQVGDVPVAIGVGDDRVGLLDRLVLVLLEFDADQLVDNDAGRQERADEHDGKCQRQAERRALEQPIAAHEESTRCCAPYG